MAGMTMDAVMVSPLAGQPAPPEMLVDPGRLVREYHQRTPDPADPAQLVSFGTSGHRGSPLTGSFTEAHIAAILARTGRDPGEHYRDLTAEFGAPCYTRIDAPATPEQKARLAKLSPEAVPASILAGDPIIAKLTRAPGNGAPIGGLKVVALSGWFAARPSGTENVYKIYAESFRDRSHLDAIVAEARAMIDTTLGRAA
jgi:phosphoglucomutase